jgi:uncharacterized protein (DUF2252 family)
MKKADQAAQDSVYARITAFNAGRDPERLALKYRAIADNPFSFYRGTCHLFYQDLPASGFLHEAPAAWICGDLHLENFGSYKGDNRLVYFDINDFDEAILAPAHWELSRLLVSIRVAARSLGVEPRQAAILCERFLDAYIAALLTGKARWIERATAEGMVRDLLRGLRKRSRAALLDSRTDLQAGKRHLRVDGKKALPVSLADRQKVVDLVAGFAKSHANPEFFKVRDVARRIAGTGSLGLERYVILVRGRGGSEGEFLLDLKIQPGSALAPYVRLPQPAWASEAERVVSLQRRVQAVSPAFLTAVSSGERSYVLRELLPSEDRVALNDWNGKLGRLEGVMRNMGEVVAWAHLRASGRQGSATADDWLGFAKRSAEWRRPLLAYAEIYARQVRKDWRAFAAEYRQQPKAKSRR